MNEIFISYSRKNNQINTTITHEVTEVIDHFISVYRYVRGDSEDELDHDYFFFDRTNISPGDSITDSIKRGIENCYIMLAFYSKQYFDSRYCFQEWQLFKQLQEKHKNKLLIPIEVRPVDNKELPKFDEMIPEWYAELTTVSGLKHNITSKILLDKKDTEPLAREVKVLIETIQEHILIQQGTSKELSSLPNILIVDTPIEKDTLESPEIREQISNQKKTFKYKTAPICIIYAGGTVGMIKQDNSDALHADYEMADRVSEIVRYLRPRLSDLPFNMFFFSLKNTIDSSNVKISDWNNLARIIREQMLNYQGFVILHGTNTMSYTASALSFVLNDVLERPVILTGSEVPISVPNTDAIHNIENAIRAAAWQSYNGPMLVPEVCVYWNNHLYRGNRVTKKYASDRNESFHTPNMPTPLATLSHDKLNVEHSLIIKRGNIDRTNVSPKSSVELDAKVSVLFMFPEMDLSNLESKYPDDLDGLILLSYGPGNSPDDPSFIKMINRLISRGTIIGNITQCPYGKVELKLFETSATLFDLGVVDGDDMTLEAAYCKLLWAISRVGNRKQPGTQASIKSTFQRNIAGEMSVSIYTMSLGSFDTFAHAEAKGIYVSDINKFDKSFSPYDISSVFLRLEGFQLNDKIKKAQIKIYFGQPSVHIDSAEDNGNLLVDFMKTLTLKEIEEERFDKNLEITHTFRKCFSNNEFQISIGVVGGSKFSFSSIRLVVYTKDREIL